MTKTPIALLACFVGMLASCSYGHGERRLDSDEQDDPGATPRDPVRSAQIDIDATIEGIALGEGAGAFVEYSSDGTWSIRTSCDTVRSGILCVWDIEVTQMNGTLSSFGDIELDGNDWLWKPSRDSVRMYAETGADLDGFWVSATLGAALRVDVYLDGYPGHRYLYWVGDGGLHRGAPENPIDLVPGL
jgi:hypothetical protein